MPKKSILTDNNTKRINVTFTNEEYAKILHLSGARNISMSSLIREWCDQGMSGQLTEQNLSFLAPILRELIDSVITPKMERMIALTAKTCMQASASAYLNAEAISGLLPDELQQDFIEVYRKARIKAVEFTRGKDST